MKFNPHTQRLFTDDHRLIKKLHCPFRRDWDRLPATADSSSRLCDICQHQVTDTGAFTDDELLALLAHAPETCLKVEFDQNNLIIIPHDVRTRE